MRWKVFIYVASKLLFYAYAIGMATGHIGFMQNQPFIIQILPCIVALAIECVCDGGKEDEA